MICLHDAEGADLTGLSCTISIAFHSSFQFSGEIYLQYHYTVPFASRFFKQFSKANRAGMYQSTGFADGIIVDHQQSNNVI